jgi:hypothetical protein
MMMCSLIGGHQCFGGTCCLHVQGRIQIRYLPQPRLSIYINGVYCMGIKAFNHLPSYMENLLDDKKKFKNTLKNYLLVNSFYSLKDFLTVNTNFKM